MALKRGTRVGPYEISAPIGAGGMGEVYRATDTKLKRDVAIKALPELAAGDRSRLARFEGEARVLASLSHPHIAAIHGLEELEGVPCLVLELVEGQTLSQLLAKAALPVGKAVELGRQIAFALEAAHEKGIIHRDLKPGNIMVTPEGMVKVLDFGLAKILEPEAAPVEASRLPTMPFPATIEGTVAGTVPYMSPEQVRGERLDVRTDIWSFGCVLYEMVTGRLAFSGKTPAELGAAILERDPNWEALRGRVTAGTERLIRRCLRRDPHHRLHDIADARIELEEAQGEATGGAEMPLGRLALHPWRTRLLWALAGLFAGALLAILGNGLRSVPPSPPPIVRATLALPGRPVPVDTWPPSVSVSPDGRSVVFRGRDLLYRRALAEDAAEPIVGTEGGVGPFFSPDGEWLAFFAGMDLLKVPVSGGTPIRLCLATPVASGGTWVPGGRVVFARSFNNPLYVVPDSGGDPQPLTHLEPDEHAHLHPQALPGGRLLFTAVVGRDFQDVTSSKVIVLDLETGERHVVLEGAAYARYVGEGWMVFVRGQSVFAAPLDLARLQVTAPPVALPETVTLDPLSRTVQLAVSRDGTLVYVSGPNAGSPNSQVFGLDRRGHETPLAFPSGDYAAPSLSPDGRKLALESCKGTRCTVLVFDRDRQVLSSVVPEPGRYFGPVWSPDGRRLALTCVFDANPRLAVRAADGSGSIESPAPPTEDGEVANSWSPDGRTIAYTVVYIADRGGSRLRGTSDIWLASSDGSTPSRPWMETPHSEIGARFSPDGAFLAYVSDESGKNEVYVRPLAGEEKIQISSGGGSEPVWAGGGRELLYRRGNSFLAVDLALGPAIRPTKEHLLFEGRFDWRGERVDMHHGWDVSSDGQEFVAVRSTSPPEPERTLMIVTGWLASLERARAGK